MFSQILMGKYTKSEILNESNLHSRMLQSKLTPNLGSFIPALREELEDSMSRKFPDCKGKPTLSTTSSSDG